MDLTMVHLLIRKRKGSYRFYIDRRQYSLKEVLAYIKLHPAQVVHIETYEEKDKLLDAYIPSNNPQIETIIKYATKAKMYKSF